MSILRIYSRIIYKYIHIKIKMTCNYTHMKYRNILLISSVNNKNYKRETYIPSVLSLNIPSPNCIYDQGLFLNLKTVTLIYSFN